MNLGLDRWRNFRGSEQNMVFFFINKINISKLFLTHCQVHFAGGCGPVPAASGGDHDSLLPYLCLPEGRARY